MPYTFATEDEDLEIMLADSLHSITVGGVTHQCLFELRGELGEETGGAAAAVLEIEVATIKADHFPAIAEGASVTIQETVAGTNSWQRQYTVLRLLPAGALTELLLQRQA